MFDGSTSPSASLPFCAVRPSHFFGGGACFCVGSIICVDGRVLPLHACYTHTYTHTYRVVPASPCSFITRVPPFRMHAQKPKPPSRAYDGPSGVSVLAGERGDEWWAGVHRVPSAGCLVRPLSGNCRCTLSPLARAGFDDPVSASIYLSFRILRPRGGKQRQTVCLFVCSFVDAGMCLCT